MNGIFFKNSAFIKTGFARKRNRSAGLMTAVLIYQRRRRENEPAAPPPPACQLPWLQIASLPKLSGALLPISVSTENDGE